MATARSPPEAATVETSTTRDRTSTYLHEIVLVLDGQSSGQVDGVGVERHLLFGIHG
jgi:hypothetical protein